MTKEEFKKIPELPHLKLEDMEDGDMELYLGILLLTDLIKGGNLSEEEKIRCTNMRNHWVALFCC